MKQFSKLVCPFELLLLWSSFLVPVATLAQQGPGGLGGIIGIQNINTTSITVQVRRPDGSKLNTLAIVNLSNMIGQRVRSQTTFGSQTVFQVGPGAYRVNVEAFGYERARVQTEVSSASPNRVVVVTLKPDTASGQTCVPGVPLSPKAQKEVVKEWSKALKVFKPANMMKRFDT